MDDNSTTESLGPLHSVDEAGLSHWTVRWRIRHGHLKPVRVGRRLMLFSRELLRVLAEEHKRKK